MRRFVRAIGLGLARLFGTTIRDCESGEVLGRALFIPWRGKIKIIGLEKPVRLRFEPQRRLTYWRQEIVFTRHPRPDFPSTGAKSEDAT